MTEKSNVSEPLPLRRDLMDAYRRSSFIGWVVAAFFALTTTGLSVFIAVRPAPLKGVDQNGKVVGTVIFDEPRLRSSNEILSDMKNLVRRCLSTSKQTVWDDISVCMNHLSPDLQGAMMDEFEASGELVKIANAGCDRVSFSYSDKDTGLTKHDRGDYFVEGIMTGSIVCNDRPGDAGVQFKLKVSATLIDKTESKPFGLEVVQYEDI